MDKRKSREMPKCIGIIMDGNRRWAKERGLPTFEGHRSGYKKLREVIEWMKEKGVEASIYYTFSTENWKRSEEEVGYLMGLIRKAFSEELDSLKKEGVRVKAAGDIKMFPEDIQEAIKKTEEETKNNNKHTVVLAASYGGRAEILHVVNKIIKEGKTDQSHQGKTETDIDEDEFSKHLWTAGVPDPDIIIRTSGEHRLSGFLPWQGVYSELFFVENHWPAFSKENFKNILDEYVKRERRYGGDGKKK